MSRTALAFMSYVNLDDQHERGRLTRFRERLSGEVRMQTGEPFDIFQDRKDIAWGQQWQERINRSLDAVTFLIPIITPAFFRSDACRDELERFLNREEELGRGDLILPVYYVKCSVLQDKAKREHDRLAQSIAARQYADWQELRFEDFTSSLVRKALAKMAEQIVEALEQREAEPFLFDAPQQEMPDNQPPKEDSAGAVYDNTISNTDKGAQNIAQGDNAIGTQINNYYPQAPPENTPQPALAAKKESEDSKTVVVDQQNQGDYATITEALEAVESGATILVKPGLYQESLVIDKSIEIMGDGEQSEIIVEVIEDSDKPVVLFQADTGKISNLTLRQLGCSYHDYGIDISKGRLELEDCDISSKGGSCVNIDSDANPILRRNSIHDGKRHGVEISSGDGQATLEENEIFANESSGVYISRSNPILRRNRIYDGKSDGVTIHGQGIVEENEIFANAHDGVRIFNAGNPILRRNRIFQNGMAGIYMLKDWWLSKGPSGTFTDNEIKDNSKGSWRHDKVYSSLEMAVNVVKDLLFELRIK